MPEKHPIFWSVAPPRERKVKNTKSKGSRAERRAMRILEAAGYVCTKAGASLGLFDVVAIGPVDVRLLQVKSGTARLSGLEREAIQALKVAPNVSREYWRFPDRCRVPLIEVL
jgi:Holliday junction resolvase